MPNTNSSTAAVTGSHCQKWRMWLGGAYALAAGGQAFLLQQQ